MQVAMVLLLVCGGSRAAWQRPDADSIFAVSDNTAQVRSLGDGAPRDVKAELHLINGSKGTRAWLYLDIDNAGVAPISCDERCHLSVSFDGQKDSFDACYDDGPFPGPFQAIKFDDAARLVAGLGQRASVRITVPVTVAADNDAGQEDRELEFAFTLEAPDWEVTQRSGVCDDDFWNSASARRSPLHPAAG